MQIQAAGLQPWRSGDIFPPFPVTNSLFSCHAINGYSSRKSKWQRECNRGTLYSTLCPDRATVGLYECFADCQPQAGPARMLLATTLRTVEALKYVRQLVRSDARPIIRHRNNNPLILYLGADAYFTLAIRQRVDDQIVQHNLYTRAIHVN